ncbi:hypothetical protein MPSEU_000114400 [Mayamaea pseudoterrestris]|nr:hypothetical protein MPSEU_000114400 [Mayamaea pseudoterrestris]
MTASPDEIIACFTALRIPKTHATVGVSNVIAANKRFYSLFANRRLPDHGWTDVQIQQLLFLLSTLDTNNKLPTCCSSNDSSDTRWTGVGEREGRVYSSLVSQRHYGFAHGMGRSGDITEPQPKAVGSSVLVKLTLLLTLDAMRRGSGLNAKTAAAHGILLPLCTGMSMSLVLSSFRDEEKLQRNIVLWSRIDQKSCFKAIQSAGMTCIVVPTVLDGDQVVTDLVTMERMLEDNAGKVLAVITTTSCFAPRIPDKVDHVAQLCASQGVYHIINNAYGLQCAKTCKLINRACVLGKVDAIVSSTDKNFLVPVGGSIVTSPSDSIIQNIGKLYAGRASSSPVIDLFITLLSMGLKGYERLLKERNELAQAFPARLQAVADRHGERLLLCTDHNTISFGITLDKLARPRNPDENENDYLKAVSKDISTFGAMLFSRCVSGTRVVPRGETKRIGTIEFKGFGSSTDNYPHAYMTAAVAIGVRPAELDEFLIRLDKAFRQYQKRLR